MTVPPNIVGAGLVILAATAFSGTSVTTVLAYEGGANPMALIAIRFVGAIIILAALLYLSGAPMRLPRRDRNIALGLGAVQAAQSYFLYNSFDHIPIGLTMTIFYIYPLLVGLVMGLSGRESLTWRLGAGLAIAFIGLLLVFNVTGEGMNTEGAVLAILASLAWTALIVGSVSLIRDRDSRPVTLHVQVSAAVLFAAVVVVSGDAELPVTGLGWLGYFLAPAFYAVAITSFFAAVALIGSVRASLIMNFEPVVTIAFGYLILSQTLTDLQLVGACFVIAALFAVRLRAPRVAADS